MLTWGSIKRWSIDQFKMHGIFVSHRGYLNSAKGGVQICTREYIDVIEAAGISLTMIPFDVDRRPMTRLRRLIDSSPYVGIADPALIERIAKEANENCIGYIFLNQVNLAPLAAEIRRAIKHSCRLILLSHGLESTDLLHL